MSAVALLTTNAAILAACFLVLWAICLRMRDVTPVDSFWALGMVIMAIASYVQTDGAPDRKMLILGLCASWGLRLGLYMLWRWRSHGPDRRYQALLGKAQTQRGWGFGKASLLLVFATQAPLLLIVCLPAQLGQLDARPTQLGVLAMIGATISVFGILFESIADWQLTRFRADPANQGQVMDRGLWRYTRHPNYFGDACVWWGIFFVAAETTTGLWALPGPILLTWTLMKWSGAPTVENRLRKTRPGYEAYMRRTSGFVPWPPQQS